MSHSIAWVMMQISKQRSRDQDLVSTGKKQQILPLLLMFVIPVAIFYVLFVDFIATEKSAAAAKPMSYKIPLAQETSANRTKTQCKNVMH